MYNMYGVSKKNKSYPEAFQLGVEHHLQEHIGFLRDAYKMQLSTQGSQLLVNLWNLKTLEKKEFLVS